VRVAQRVLYLLGLMTLIGLLKVNLCGPGIGESVKSLWKKPPAKEKAEKGK
jgi:hypothetical protein